MNQILKVIQAACVAGLLAAACGDVEDDDSCTKNKTVQNAYTLTNLTARKITTGDARKDCHADFKIAFRWANAERARTDTLMPMIYWRFQVHPGFSYFPTGAAARRKTSDGLYEWAYELSIGAKNEKDEFIQYEIETQRPDFMSDSVYVAGSIAYTAYKK